MALAYLRGVATLDLDVEKCTGCGICVEVCPHSVFVIKDSKVAIVDRDACMECGACALNCPLEAIAVVSGVGCAKAIIRGLTGEKKGNTGSRCQAPGEGNGCCGSPRPSTSGR